ncbi:MAG: hypothetical protein KGJ62_14510 [Armatimonadetes bacterium]|nr:hypothetical protein [Armatimonadota bacterium]MDE2207319.1 hypothetical protein [Armatimonadota bacterium]
MRKLLSMDGAWNFSFNGRHQGAAQVPGAWEASFPALRGKAGCGRYARVFPRPELPPGHSLWLKFGAADHTAFVTVDGEPLLRHEGGYTPFEVRAPASAAGTIDVVVDVYDAAPGEDVLLPDGDTLSFAEIPHGKQSWYGTVGGLWQGVEMEIRPDLHISHLSARGDWASASAQVDVQIAEDWSGIPPDCSVEIAIFTPDGSEAARAEVAAAPTISLELDSGSVAPWSPDHPALYRCRTVLRRGSEQADEQDQRFGFRTITRSGGEFLLNGEPLILRGALDQAFYPVTLITEPPDTVLRDQFAKAKALGLNLLRCHIKIPDPRYLDLCDEMGLLVWYELPNGDRLTETFRRRAADLFDAARRRDAHHPCIIAWTVINEAWGIDLADGEQRDWLAGEVTRLRRIAPDWMVVDNSACGDNFHVVTDICDYHAYFNIPDATAAFEKLLAAAAEPDAPWWSPFGDARKSGDEPLLLSEFGNWGLPSLRAVYAAEGPSPWWMETGDGATHPGGMEARFEQQGLAAIFGDVEGLAKASQYHEWIALKYQIERLRRHPRIRGYVITEFTDVQWEANGLMDFSRNHKCFSQDLADIQGEYLVAVDGLRNTWRGQQCQAVVYASCCAPRLPEGSTLRWIVEERPELTGTVPTAAMTPAYPAAASSCFWAPIEFDTSSLQTTNRVWLRLELLDGANRRLARNRDPLLVVAQADRQEPGVFATIEAAGLNAEAFTSHMQPVGIGTAPALHAVEVLIADRITPELLDRVRAGARAVVCLAQQGQDSLPEGITHHSRDERGWWGDWCGSLSWLRPGAFPSQPPSMTCGMEWSGVTPHTVFTGFTPEETLAGIFVGWIHNPAAVTGRRKLDAGTLVLTTFRLLPALENDPIAALVLRDLIIAAASS